MADESPKISIIVPVYNGEKFLNQCLTSIQNQSYLSLEVLIVDDGSTDKTKSIIRNFCATDPRFKIVEHKQNKGLPTALNSGHKKSTGEYQTWISHDNYLGPDYLELMLRAFDSHNMDIVYSDYFEIDANNQMLGKRQVESIENISCGNIFGASFMYRSSVTKTLNGFQKEKFMFEDYDFFVRAFLQNFQFYRVESMPYYYRQHSNQLTLTRKLPDSYFDYRLQLLDICRSNVAEIRARGAVSLLHLCLVNSKWVISIKVIFSHLFPDIVKVSKYVISKLMKGNSHN